jgi:inorganic pyrophosphatase
MNPWHPWHSVNIGKKSPSLVTAIIEIPKGSKCKYEIDKISGMLCLDRVLSSAVVYPTNYGFIPQTYCDDGDALDILVLGQEPAQPLCQMKSKVIGAMKMIDGGEEDDKIIAVHADDPQYRYINELAEVNPQVLKEIEQFFRSYKALEKKVVEIKGWATRTEAEAIVLASVAHYNKNKDALLQGN